MSFHVSNFGAAGKCLAAFADLRGMVPEHGDGAWTLSYDHGAESTHSDNGELTDYGEWWEADRWPEIVAEAVRATEEAGTALREWQRSS
jgi:hypothetical protein